MSYTPDGVGHRTIRFHFVYRGKPKQQRLPHGSGKLQKPAKTAFIRRQGQYPKCLEPRGFLNQTAFEGKLISKQLIAEDAWRFCSPVHLKEEDCLSL